MSRRGKAESASRRAISVSAIAFEDRPQIVGPVINAVHSEMTDEHGGPVESSYPHLTHQPPPERGKPPGRPAHVTSSRVVAEVGPFLVHQRFHQNEDGLSPPLHDRFFAVHAETGMVHASRARMAEGHQGKFAALPERGQPIGVAMSSARLSFEVGDPDEKHPPLSPRSMRRTLDDDGYK